MAKMTKAWDAKRKTKKTKTRKVTEWPTYNLELRFDPDELHHKLRIDKHDLDSEVEQQPELYGEVAEASALSKSEVESLEEQIKELEADLDTQARADAETEGDRITENAIKAIIAGDKDRKSMVIKLLNARHLQRRLEALTTSFRHRSYALRDMVDLYLASYYSSLSASGMHEDKKEAEVDRLTGKMKDRREKRVKRHRKRPS